MNITKLLKILLLSFIGLSFQIRPTENSETKFEDNRKIIVLDPGHGMSNKEKGKIDYGANYKNFYEANIVLQQAKIIRKMLNPLKYRVVLTREDNLKPTPVEYRPKLADSLNADLFISLHVNNFRLKSIKGFEIYYERDKDISLAKILAKNLEGITPITKRKIKKENYKMLDKVKCPAILIESGYISNKHDRKYILDTIPDIEKAITKTIENYLDQENLVH